VTPVKDPEAQEEQAKLGKKDKGAQGAADGSANAIL